MPTFTKKHYEKIAELINKISDACSEQDVATEELLREFSQLFSEDNPRFDEKKFRIACAKEQ